MAGGAAHGASVTVDFDTLPDGSPFVAPALFSAATPLRGSRLAEGAAFFEDRLLVEGLQALADRTFRHSVTLDQVPADGSPIGPSALEQRVIRLMSTGVTDDVAARRLYVTDRQYRRYVAAVMRRLGATSRFQAGMLATERGWLPAWPDEGSGPAADHGGAGLGLEIRG